jgi:predicted ATP-grasp superfamily ATP-dependent carboligase
MARPRVLIVGVSTRALAESACRAGWECASVDAFGDLDLKARGGALALTRDLGRPYSAAAAVALGRRFPVEAAAYVGNLENHPVAVRRLAEGRELLGNSAETLARARDVFALAREVRRAGARVPETRVPGTARSLPAAGDWLRKPARGGGGSGVRRFVPGRELRRDEILQECVVGTLGSVSFAADGRRAVLLGLAEGLAGDPAFGASGFRYCGSLYPFAPGAVATETLDAVAQAVTRAFGLVGVNGIDFVLQDGEPVILELNPRYSASMELIERRGGPSVFEVHAAACRGKLPAPRRLPSSATATLGKAVVWARRDLVAGDTRGWLARDDVRDIPHPGERIRRGHPVCTVFAHGHDAATCRRRLVEAAAVVEREITAESSGARA